MEINLTLLAQILHFFVAWLLIQKLLLEPALQSIFEEQNEDRKKKFLIDSLKKEYTQRHQYKQAQWEECQRQFTARTPADTRKVHLLRAVPMSKDMLADCYKMSLTPEEVKKVAQVITKQIERLDD